MKYHLSKIGLFVLPKKNCYLCCSRRFVNFVAHPRRTCTSIMLTYLNTHLTLDVGQIYIPIRDAYRLQSHCHLLKLITMVVEHGFMDYNNKSYRRASAMASLSMKYRRKIMFEMAMCCPWTLARLLYDPVVSNIVDTP